MPRIIADGQPAGAGGGVSIGDVSYQLPFAEDWTSGGASPPAAGPSDGTKGNFATLDFDPDTDNGIFFNVQVPDDYDSGDLTLYISYCMSSSVASPNNTIRVYWEADIIDVTAGTIDTASYPGTGATHTVPEDQSIVRQNVASIIITSGDFEAGDTIQFRIKRDADHGDDDHTGFWKVIDLVLAYTGQVATREAIQNIEIFADTDETAPAAGTKGNFATIDFSASADNEQKFLCYVPDNWDGASDLAVRLTYAMSSTSGGVVVLETEGDIADVRAGSLGTISSTKINLPVPTNADPHRTVIIRAISATDLGIGDSLEIKLARRAGTDANDTAADLFKVIDATIITGVSPKTGFDSIVVEEHYLYAHDFDVTAGSPTGDQLSPKLGQTFETWARVLGNGASESMDVSFQGRLMSTQSTVASIKVPIMAIQYLTHGVLTGSWVEGETVTSSGGGSFVIWEVIDSTHLWVYSVSGTLPGTLTGASGSASYVSIVAKGQYVLKVYVEDATPDTAAYESNSGTPQDAPTTRTVLTVTNADPDLDTRQPDFASGREGRFFVVVECSVDANETVLVGRPFVGLE